ncbi:MAG: ABC transporter ATP-binding protein [Chitinophagales bacterium]|nr:ABC transporter ATP-binding protein [Chitinophagales bacterium]
MAQHILEVNRVSKYFHDPVKMQVLRDVSFSVKPGEFVSITGKSGCGKSTLLYIISTMDTDFEGELFIEGNNMRNLKESALARVRNEKIGFVFQFHYLLNEFSVLKNVMLPGMKLGKFPEEQIEQMAYEKLRILGIEQEAHKKPNQLSGGQKQRVAIARALINDPVIIMGDEPTGNLDKTNSEIVFNIFRELSENYNQSMLIVTHDIEFAQRTNRIIEMEDGKIVAVS